MLNNTKWNTSTTSIKKNRTLFAQNLTLCLR